MIDFARGLLRSITPGMSDEEFAAYCDRLLQTPDSFVPLAVEPKRVAGAAYEFQVDIERHQSPYTAERPTLDVQNHQGDD